MTDSAALSFSSNAPLTGDFIVPGDKSISHRSLMIASQALGPTLIEGLLEGSDVMATLAALQQLGVSISRVGNRWKVIGNGLGSLQESDNVLDLGNAGTGVRLLMGLVSAYSFTTTFTGDESLRHRPMARVTDPLKLMGAQITARQERFLPITLQGGRLVPIEYKLPVASAQVKSAILLAGLNSMGTTTILEPTPSRDHTERMLNAFGFECTTSPHDTSGNRIELQGQQAQTYTERTVIVPADPSSAAFPIVAALITPGSRLRLSNICMNPLRTGLFDTLIEMGASLTFDNHRESGGEPIADITVEYSKLQGITVPAERAPSMIDEYPILCIAAALATGSTRMCGLHELRVKESNRLDTMAEGLQQCGIKAIVEGDDLIVHGSGNADIAGHATIDSKLDHRIAMSFLTLGLRSQQRIDVHGTETINTSFPGFVPLMESIGVQVASSDIQPSFSPRSPLVVAIDGPAASGKGTLARRLAEALGLVYLDTGSLYRAVGMKLVYNDKDIHDKIAAIEAANSISIQDLSNPRLRQERVGNAASVVSAIPEVREALLQFQRKIAASPQGAVLDGRDIGTVICPDAQVKLFITANIETRAERRHRELQGQGIEVVYNSVLADLKERDDRDKGRTAAPLIPATDATIIDTSSLSANQVFEKAMSHIRTIIEHLPVKIPA